MAILSPQLSEYLDNLLGLRPAEMQKMEGYAEEHGFPIIGPACGQLCYQIAHLAGATRIYELGSGYGYSPAWFARAVKENGGGEVHHVVWDEELSRMARGHLEALGYGDIVQYTVGEAVDALGNADGQFDLIFMDIDKEGYPGALPLIYEKLKPGGVLIVDNVLWSGRIFDDKDQSGATQGIRELTGMLASNDAWVNSIIPIRDGLMVATKQA